MRKFGLIGFPLSHSFSPQYFADKFRQQKISNCSYEAFPIPAIDQLQKLIENTEGLEGLNVTIPYKKQVLSYLTSSNQAVVDMQACNCIAIKGNQLIGYNTDVTGFKQSLTPMLQPHHNKALILGTGGSAAAVRYVLQQLNIPFTSVSRTAGKNILTYKDVTTAIVSQHKLIINTTPLGMYPLIDDCAPIPYHALTPEHYLFDLVYNPVQTLFLKKGTDVGAVVKNGGDMLIIQAEESWKIWNSF